jgi:hypothetical protein
MGTEGVEIFTIRVRDAERNENPLSLWFWWWDPKLADEAEHTSRVSIPAD